MSAPKNVATSTNTKPTFSQLNRAVSHPHSLRGGEYEGFEGGDALANILSRATIREGLGKTVTEENEKEEGHARGNTSSDEEERGVSVVEGRMEERAVELTADEEREALAYARFSDRRKSAIVAIVAYAALLAPFSSSSFLPSIPNISSDLSTSPETINVSIAIFIVVLALFPLFWAPYAGMYGRRPIYCTSLPIFTIGSLGTALSPNFAALVGWRIVQAIGSSAVLAVGAGTIGDLYPRERRGKAMGYFYGGILIGPALAPLFGGVLTQYLPNGWRAMQYLLCAMGGVASLLVFLCLPETAHFRGIDILREERAHHRAEIAAKRAEAGTGVSSSEETTVEKESTEEVVKDSRKVSFSRRVAGWKEDAVWLNPLVAVKILVNPHILAMSLNSSFILMSTYTILVPLAYTLAARYNITDAALLGTLYLASGLGNAVSSQISGRWADYVLRTSLLKRGFYKPEDRLKAALVGSGFVLPVSVLTFGWIVERVEGKAGLGLAIVFLFFNGVGLMLVLTPTNTYCVDVMPTRAPSCIAVNNACRYLFSAAASAFVLPLVKAVGIGWTNTLSAALCWVGFGLILLTMRYGEQMREMGARWEGLEEPEPRSGTTDSKASLVSSPVSAERDVESPKPVGK